MVGIFEGVSGAVVDLDADLLSQLLERLFKFVNFVGGDAVVQGAVKSKDRSVDFRQRHEVGIYKPKRIRRAQNLP